MFYTSLSQWDSTTRDPASLNVGQLVNIKSIGMNYADYIERIAKGNNPNYFMLKLDYDK